MRTGNAHLTYCTNIYPAERGDEVETILSELVPKVASRVAGTAPFGVGLRLSNAASLDWRAPSVMDRVKASLEANNLYVFSLNGFPFGGFHGESVKDRVHIPDWTTPSRVDYTRRLIEQLTQLLPEAYEGSISTSPLGFRGHHADAEAPMSQAAVALADLIPLMAEIERRTGKWIHLDLEPEPDGLLETTAELIRFFEEHLLRLGIPHLRTKHGLSATKAEALIRRHLGICFDVCHSAVVFESPAAALDALERSGIRVGKVQLSAALEARWQSRDECVEVRRALAPFDESVYLHQTHVQLNASGDRHAFSDLGPALDMLPTEAWDTLRTHFHVPIFLEHYGVLRSTQDAIVEVLQYQRDRPITRHFEIETYTFDVLPPELRIDRASSIAREIRWVRDQLPS